MDKELFIKRLEGDLKPATALRSPYFMAFIFFSIVILPIALIVIVLGMREDISFLNLKLNYVVEGLILILLFFSILISSLKSREPGVSYEFEKTCAILLFLMWMMSSEYIGHAEQSVQLEEPEYSCARLVFISTMLFGCSLYFFVRKGYLVNPTTSFFMSVFAGATLGAILLHLVCPGDTSSHLLFWHVIPVIVWPTLVCGGYWWWRGEMLQSER